MEGQEQKAIVVILNRVMETMVWATAGIIIVIMLFIAYDILLRYSIGKQTQWITDFVALFLIIYLAMLPAAWILLKRGHVSIDLFVSLLRPKHQYYITLSTNILGLLYSAVLTWQGGLFTWREATYATNFPTTSWLPVWPAVIAIVIGGVLLCLAFIMKIVAQIWFPDYDISPGERFE